MNKKFGVFVLLIVLLTAGGLIYTFSPKKEQVQADGWIPQVHQAPSADDADKQKGLDEMQYIQDHLENTIINKPKIPVSDPRLARVQDTFSNISQPFSYKMKYDDSTGNATYVITSKDAKGNPVYTDGFVVSKQGRVIVRPNNKEGKPMGATGDLIPPLVRTLSAQLAQAVNNPDASSHVFEIISRINELEDYTDAMNLTDVTGYLIEINSFIRNDPSSFKTAVQRIVELNKLINFDQLSND
ncbi:hypothetical protein PP175_13150 [Aneurinibacillus sp. Ricciae_BoGa-3]|uniref:hypothetical protein n=1 Tax=Aneurinibacillus sp. Ricciae_BoGa-3 TaxID=3022697 RepID=UPI002340D111|nr:hypothetical protein [Aneurinibacillus sp. Ricciae_BoGa-3]WCK52405.1 hypothetical protein PP175_13150 [Aneurinibacillus sp. Ricciae_BoGa-3]